MNSVFPAEYKKLNKQQKRAVDAIDGPVMVVAGPGTGKTQVLALRIANILNKTDTGAEGILCLTFTNSGVRAMRQRLLNIIGRDAAKVRIATFHSFALDLIQKNYNVLDLNEMPEILDDVSSIAIADDLLEKHDWEYLRSRANSSEYFYDIKSLISLLKRERVNPSSFLQMIQDEIESLRLDPGSISSRGPTAGEIKKEVVKKIEGLKRTSEVVKFYELYEEYKKSHYFIDYDDVIALLTELVSISEDVVSELRESFLYVLVDEHQDSSGIQNEFLEKVWKGTEKPNIFVVGDDRQLIYGFGGASLSYFENFKTLFGKAELITLIENYRSSQVILDAADSLLQSSIVKDKLQSQNQVKDPVTLYEAPYQRDEIILAGMEIKKRIDAGLDPNECAILLPKNSQVRNAITILKDLGLPVASSNNTDLFNSSDALVIINILKIVANPYDAPSIAEYLLRTNSGVAPLLAHKFLKAADKRILSLETLSIKNEKSGLFATEDPIYSVGQELSNFATYGASHGIYETIQYIGEIVLLKKAKNHEELTLRGEVIRTMLHLALALKERANSKINPDISIQEYLLYLDRLNEYNQHIPLAVFGKNEGVKVMTLHGSKGLEFDFVWVAHMDERSLFSGKKNAFSLPEKLESLVEEKDDLVVKRQVYVAMTRAKRFCNLSFARESYTGGDLELAHIFGEISPDLIVKKSLAESEKLLLKDGIENIVTKKENIQTNIGLSELANIVKDEYEKTKVSVTLLNNFFECPWKWYFRNLLQLPEVKSPSLTFGSIIHSCVEDLIHEQGGIDDLKMLELVRKHIVKNSVMDINEIRRIEKDAVKILNSWVKNRLPNISKIRESERSLSYKDKKFPYFTIYGKIDLTERFNDGSIKVTDFKTGKSKTKNEIEKKDEEGRMSSYLRQLSMYSYLVQGAEKKDVSESVLEFVEADLNDKNSLYITRITQEEIDLLLKDITDYDNLLKNGEWVNRTCTAKVYNGGQCEYCSLANNIYSLS